MYIALLRTIKDFDIQSAPDHLESVAKLAANRFASTVDNEFHLRPIALVSTPCHMGLPKRRLAKRMTITVHLKHNVNFSR